MWVEHRDISRKHETIVVNGQRDAFSTIVAPPSWELLDFRYTKP